MRERVDEAGIARQLARGAWFDGLPGRLGRELVGAGRVWTLAQGARVPVGDDRRAGGLHAVLAGRVRLSKVGPLGNELVLHVAGPGFWFGALAVLTGRDSGVAATADGDATLLTVGGASLARLRRREPDLEAALARLALDRLAHAVEALEHLARPEATSRVAATLLAQRRLRQHGDRLAGSRPLEVSQATLAAMTGLSRQSVNRVLGELARRGLVGAAFRRIELLDAAGLARLAGEADPIPPPDAAYPPSTTGSSSA